MIVASCDTEITTVSLTVEGSPNKIIYIANVDTEINLSGLRFVDTMKNGKTNEVDLGDWKNPDQEPGRIVFHEIDFAKPGVYEVEILREWRYRGGWRGKDMILSYIFYVEVVEAG